MNKTRPDQGRETRSPDVTSDFATHTGKHPLLPPDIAPGTDAANAAFLVQAGFADSCRYVPGVGWRKYDPERGFWVTVRDRDQLLHFTAELLQPLIADYGARLPGSSRYQNEELQIWWRRVGNASSLANTLRYASGLQELTLDLNGWDPDHHLINVENGVLNLLDGTLTSHNPNHLMTGQANVTYLPGATHPTVEDMLTNFRRQGIEDYLSRAAGRALSGRVEAEEILLFLGEGGTGKGSFISALVALLGSYAGTVPIQALLLNRHGEASNAARPYLSHTVGKRLIVANEVPENAKLNAALVKELTGRDVVTVRDLYQSAIEFRPVFALWIQSNFPLHTGGDDTGLERRLRIVPFKNKPVVEIVNYKQQLQEPLALSALLNWALHGYQKWYADGRYDHGDSTAVMLATESHWWGVMPAREFVQKCVQQDDKGFIPSRELITGMDEWLKARGLSDKPGTSMADLFLQLRRADIKSAKRSQVRGWRAKWFADE